MSEPTSPKSDSELMVNSTESMLRAESHIQWAWGEFPESTRVWLIVGTRLKPRVEVHMFVYRHLVTGADLCYMQVNKKDKPEPKTLTITPSENTHFRVILSSEAMEEEMKAGGRNTDAVCSIVKPEPRTIKPDQCSCKTQSGNTNIAEQSEPQPPNAVSGTSPSDPELNTQAARKARWTSSPPSRSESSAAADGGNSAVGDSASVGPSSKAADSPIKRRGTKTRVALFNALGIKGRRSEGVIKLHRASSEL